MKQIIAIFVLILLLFSLGCEKAEEEPEDIEEPIEEEIIEQPTCPDNCDDEKDCTKDYCNKDTDFECIHDTITLCCGNDICEITEDNEECAEDCPICETFEDCEEPYFDYSSHECKTRPIRPCCGNDVCDLLEDHESCSEDCDEPLLGLEDFPDFFDDDTLIIVGNKAPAIDVISATELSTTLQRENNLELVSVLTGDIGELDDLEEDAILIGKPCDNHFISELLDLEEDCETYLDPNTAVIKLIFDDNTYVIITGYSAEDTREGIAELISGGIDGQEEVVYT
jgi:hypothetical protein